MLLLPAKPVRRKVPFPEALPGEFCVVAFDRDAGHYTVHLDDADRSSYLLGTALEATLQLRKWGLRAGDADSLVNLAREYRSAQFVIRGERIVPLHPKPKPVALVWPDTAEGDAVVFLPSLGGRA